MLELCHGEKESLREAPLSPAVLLESQYEKWDTVSHLKTVLLQVEAHQVSSTESLLLYFQKLETYRSDTSLYTR